MSKLGFKFYYTNGDVLEQVLETAEGGSFRFETPSKGFRYLEISNTTSFKLDALILPNGVLGKVQILFEDKLVKELDNIEDYYYRYYPTDSGLLEVIHCDIKV